MEMNYKFGPTVYTPPHPRMCICVWEPQCGSDERLGSVAACAAGSYLSLVSNPCGWGAIQSHAVPWASIPSVFCWIGFSCRCLRVLWGEGLWVLVLISIPWVSLEEAAGCSQVGTGIGTRCLGIGTDKAWGTERSRSRGHQQAERE